MPNSPKKSLQEMEVKYFVKDLADIEKKLKELNAPLLSERTYELNYRFDTPDGKLAQQMQVLRLRQYRSTTLTFKSAADPKSEVSSRQEIEFEVSNFQAAMLFLQALGFQISFIYEKYRTIYQLGDCAIMLDELPYGNFIEVEGKDVAAIKKASRCLQLEWNSRIKLSYLALFYKLKEKYDLKADHLVFKELDCRQIPVEEFFTTLTNGS